MADCRDQHAAGRFGGLANGAMLGMVVEAMLTGYEQQLLPAPLHLLLFGFLGFALVSLGDGVLTLLWRPWRSVPPASGGPAAAGFQAVPQAQVGRLIAVLLFCMGPFSSRTAFGHYSHARRPIRWSARWLLAGLPAPDGCPAAAGLLSPLCRRRLCW